MILWYSLHFYVIKHGQESSWHEVEVNFCILIIIHLPIQTIPQKYHNLSQVQIRQIYGVVYFSQPLTSSWFSHKWKPVQQCVWNSLFMCLQNKNSRAESSGSAPVAAYQWICVPSSCYVAAE